MFSEDDIPYMSIRCGNNTTEIVWQADRLPLPPGCSCLILPHPLDTDHPGQQIAADNMNGSPKGYVAVYRRPVQSCSLASMLSFFSSIRYST